MKYELPPKKKLVHEMHIPVRWNDMDALGHVNNVSYFRYMEIARLQWLRELGYVFDPQGGSVVIANTFCNFHRQFEYPDAAIVRTYVSNPGRSSYESWVTMEKAGEPGALCATGGATTIWVNAQTKKSAPLPAWLRAAIEE